MQKDREVSSELFLPTNSFFRNGYLNKKERKGGIKNGSQSDKETHNDQRRSHANIKSLPQNTANYEQSRWTPNVHCRPDGYHVCPTDPSHPFAGTHCRDVCLFLSTSQFTKICVLLNYRKIVSLALTRFSPHLSCCTRIDWNLRFWDPACSAIREYHMLDKASCPGILGSIQPCSRSVKDFLE